MNKYLLGGAMAAAMVAIAPAIGQTPAPAPVAPQAHNPSAWQGRASVQTRAEVAAHVRAMFDRLDGNHDGSITKAEAEAAKVKHGDWAGKRMERHDGAGGQMADRGAMFDRMDANRDGSISRDEFTRAPMHGGRDEGGTHGTHMGMSGGLGGHMFDLADSNHDGRVTLQEATAAALRHFDMADVNRDGQLTPEERTQMHQRMHSERRPG